MRGSLPLRPPRHILATFPMTLVIIINSIYFGPSSKKVKNFSCTFSSSSGTNSKTCRWSFWICTTAWWERAGKVFHFFWGVAKVSGPQWEANWQREAPLPWALLRGTGFYCGTGAERGFGVGIMAAQKWPCRRDFGWILWSCEEQENETSNSLVLPVWENFMK